MELREVYAKRLLVSERVLKNNLGQDKELTKEEKDLIASVLDMCSNYFNSQIQKIVLGNPPPRGSLGANKKATMDYLTVVFPFILHWDETRQLIDRTDFDADMVSAIHDQLIELDYNMNGDDLIE